MNDLRKMSVEQLDAVSHEDNYEGERARDELARRARERDEAVMLLRTNQRAHDVCQIAKAVFMQTATDKDRASSVQASADLNAIRVAISDFLARIDKEGKA